MNFGLTEKHLNSITDALKLHPEIEAAKIFGSRALQTHRPGSDIDIALYGEAVTLTTLLKLAKHFDESDMPWLIDLTNYNNLKNSNLKQHIDQKGITIFHK